MNRRHFLGTMMASVAALSIDPASLMWRPDETAAPLTPEAIASFRALLTAFAKGISKQLGDADFRFVGASKLGDDHMAHQFNIGLHLPRQIGPEGLDADRYLSPMVQMMGQRLREAKPKAFGELLLPQGVEEAVRVYTPNGICVRGLQIFDPLGDYDVIDDDIRDGPQMAYGNAVPPVGCWKTRVDVLCG